MTNDVVSKFIEERNCTYLYLLLANEEFSRLSKVPQAVRKKFEKKLTTMALEHVATNNIPDYMIPEEEDTKLEGKMAEIIDEPK